MTKNREISELIFNKIKSFGFKPYDINYGNGYFIFDRGEDSVIRFRIKGCRHWKFGLWINSEYLTDEYKQDENTKYEDLYEVVSIFAQYDTCIDKFKPSRSDHCVEYRASDWESTIESPYGFHQVEDMIGHIKRHPFIAYFGDKYDKSYIWYFVKNELSDKIYKAKKSIKENSMLYWTKFKLLIANHNKYVSKIEIIDRNTSEWKISPRYIIDCEFIEESTPEQECKFLDFWFHKDYYDDLHLQIHKVGSEKYYSYARD